MAVGRERSAVAAGVRRGFPDNKGVVLEMNEIVIKLEKRFVEVVRCKNCKHGVKSPTFRYYPEITWCNKYLKAHNDEWYCADGERK